MRERSNLAFPSPPTDARTVPPGSGHSDAPCGASLPWRSRTLQERPQKRERPGEGPGVTRYLAFNIRLMSTRFPSTSSTTRYTPEAASCDVLR